jgi:hypothetical protein
LLDEVSEAFLESVNGTNGFLSHPTLKYHWVRYIPVDHVADDFWRRLKFKILDALKTRNFFFSSTLSCLRPAQELRIVPNRYRYGRGGEVLLPDIVAKKRSYISESYDADKDLPVLRSIGTEDLSAADFLERLAVDLDNAKGLMRSVSTSQSWHSFVASELCRILRIKHGQAREYIKGLPIIPLQNGNWARPLNASIFFPTSEGVKVPPDLPLSLVDAKTIRNTIRKALFSMLGVTECEPARIFPLIEQRYRVGGISFTDTVKHLNFLFWHHEKLPLLGISIQIVPENPDRCRSFNSIDNGGCWTYCPLSNNPYSMWNILNGSIPNELLHRIRIPNREYYEELEKWEKRDDRRAKEWFQGFLHVREAPQLTKKKAFSQERSFELEYIAENVAEKLLGVLKQNWSHYLYSEEWDNYFKHTKVPILDSEQFRDLEDTFLPLPRLRAIVVRLDLEEDFGFLKEVEDVRDATANEWRFLERFGVGVEEDVRFWLRLLDQARNKESVEETVIFDIYSRLQSFAGTESESLKYVYNILRKCRTWLTSVYRKAFEGKSIFIPSGNSESPGFWTTPESCVWDGPEWFNWKHRIIGIPRYRALYSLFKVALGLPDANLEDFLQNLKDIRKSNTINASDKETANLTLKIYGKLNEKAFQPDKDKIRYVMFIYEFFRR